MAISAATDVVGYFLYLDLLGELVAAKTRHGYDLGEETDRVQEALNLAAAGKNVKSWCQAGMPASMPWRASCLN